MTVTINHELLTNGTCRIFVYGKLSIHDGQAPLLAVQKILSETTCHEIILDLSDVDYMDSAGITLIVYLKHLCKAQQIPFQLNGTNKNIDDLLSMLDTDSLEQSFFEKPSRSFLLKNVGSYFSEKLSYIGETSLAVYNSANFIFTFIGDTILTLIQAVRRPKSLRIGDILRCIERNGFDAIPVIMLLNFLIGVVMAYQAAIQLRQFGANIYVADLVGLSQTREFGPMITAIILVGRSGSAFAAEIGSMKVNEEIDALETMGISPMQFLVAPKIIALLIALPLLTLIADLVGIAGGLFVGISALGLTVQGYLLETSKAIDLFDVFSGIFKSIAFAALIAGIGCLRGLQVEGGADSVGKAATSAVVSGIFMILVADAIFTVIFQYV